MASIRELRSRIRSVNSTKKITKAQELIATSRITKAQARVAEAKPYSVEMTSVLSELAGKSTLDHPLLVERDEPKRAAVLVVTSDRGMCGGYNSNVLRETRELIQLLKDEGKEAVLYVMGQKGVDYFTFRGQDIADSWTGFSQQPRHSDAAAATDVLVKLFQAGSDEYVTLDGDDSDGDSDSGGRETHGVDELHIVFTKFVSMLSQNPEVRRMAPLVVEESDDEADEADRSGDSDSTKSGDDDSGPRNFAFEPSADTLLSALLPKYITTRVYAALLDSAASESAARRTAMKAATDNADELAVSLSREANRMRQAQITQEISEIVGGAGALAN